MHFGSPYAAGMETKNTPQACEELQEILDRPPEAKPRIVALPTEPSILSAS